MTTITERTLTLSETEKRHYSNYLTLLKKAFDLTGDEAKHEALKRIEANRKEQNLRSTKALAIR